MNPSYEDPSSDDYPRSGGRQSSGRARVPDPADGYDDGYSHRAGSDARHDDGYERPTGSPARASAAVPPPPPAGRAAVSGASGTARVPSGRASVRPSGYDEDDYDYPGERTGQVAGRASVGAAPVSPAAGRASVGRARVGGDDGDFDGPGDPRRPSRGPGGRGPGGRGPDGPDGPDDGDGDGPPVKKRSRKRTWILSAIAAFIMLSGLVVVLGAYQFNNIPEPQDYIPPQSTTIFYSDGATPMAKLGTQNRTLITLDQSLDNVRWAVVATEDMTFYSNSGVSFRGIARAAWNNVKGGDTQGGSTISQQYMRQTLTDDPSQRNYKVKIKEALGAIKLDEKYSKDKILEMYLNVIFFGRGAYGIEAASQVYFGKAAKDLKLEEAMVLADVIQDPGGRSSDPEVNPAHAQERWDYTKGNLVKLGKISKDQAAAMQYPKTWKPWDKNKDTGEFGKDLPTGLIVHHVMDELSTMKDATGNPKFPNLQGGGYKITTTINKGFQDQVYSIASVNGSRSEVKKQALNPAIVQAGVVSVDPATGEVLAYYGGDNGAGTDYSGLFRDPVLGDGQLNASVHSPGSTMKIYTLGAAIQAGYAIDSYWSGPPTRTFPGRPTPVRNAEKSAQWASGTTLVTALQMSLNTVYYAVGSAVGAGKIVDLAHNLGINYMADQNGTIYNLNNVGDLNAFAKDKGIGNEVAIGQYGITVQDHANAVATIAAGGTYRPAHFVKSATGPNGFKYTAPTKQRSLTGDKVLSTQQFDDLRYSMKQVLTPGAGNGYDGLRPNGWDTGGKSGTWESNEKSSDNSDAWFVGFTPKLATAVWVGNVKERLPIRIKNGSSKGKELAGANLPGAIFKATMIEGLKVVKQTKNEKIATPTSFTGDSGRGETSSPQPTAPPQPTNTPCVGMLCPTTGPGNGGGPGGGNGGSATASPSASRSKRN